MLKKHPVARVITRNGGILVSQQLQNINYIEKYNFCIAMWPTKVPLRGTNISLYLPPSCEPQRGSCMVLLMIRLFEPFDLFEVVSWSFATASVAINI